MARVSNGGSGHDFETFERWLDRRFLSHALKKKFVIRDGASSCSDREVKIVKTFEFSRSRLIERKLEREGVSNRP